MRRRWRRLQQQRRLERDQPRVDALPSSSSLPKLGAPQDLPSRCLQVHRRHRGLPLFTTHPNITFTVALTKLPPEREEILQVYENRRVCMRGVTSSPSIHGLGPLCRVVPPAYQPAGAFVLALLKTVN
jgi:hypothetical protein